MTTEVVTRESAGTNLAIGGEQKFFNDAQTAALVQMGLGEAPRGDIEAFFHQAKRSGLDPFARQIYMIERRSKVRGEWVSKWTIQTSIDGFRVIRDRKGTFRGMEEHWCGPDGEWRDAWLETGPPAAARITLHLDGFVVPITAVARYDEYVPTRNGEPTGQWGKMPALMTSKVAEALALRKAYPQDFSGLYTSDEMAQAGNSPAPQAVSTAPSSDAQVIEGEVVEEAATPNPAASLSGGAAEEPPVQRAIDEPSWQEQIMGAVSEASVERLRALWEHAQSLGVLGAPYGDEGLRLGDVLRQAKARIEEASS